MAVIPWTDKYSVRIEKIDEQHKKLVSYINQLYEAMLNKNKEQVIIEILDGLTIYTVHHFRTEEQLMITHSYSDYNLHKKQHEELEKKVTAFKESLLKGDRQIAIELAQFLKSWLINHIASSDQILGKYLKTKGVN